MMHILSRRLIPIVSIPELNQRYKQLHPIDGVNSVVIDKIEGILNIKLPFDFQQIASFYSGGLLGGISVFAISHGGITPNIVEETLRLRNAINLPSRFVVLAEPPESLIVMDTENIPSVIWCDATDVERLNNISLLYTPQTWNTYFEFFDSLLTDEEEVNV